jgi:4-hydroxybenzoate polyprenyltransferase
MLTRVQQAIVGLLAAITLFYGFVDIPFLKPARKLRDFGLVKTFFVALVWSVTTVLVPLSGTFVETDMLVFLLLRRFLFVLALTITFEIKDLKSDEEYHLQTIPMHLGISNTKLLVQGILFLLILINTLQYFFFSISLPNMLAVNLSLFVSIFCIQPVNEETKDWWYYFVLDGMMILQFVFVYVALFFFQ